MSEHDNILKDALEQLALSERDQAAADANSPKRDNDYGFWGNLNHDLIIRTGRYTNDLHEMVAVYDNLCTSKNGKLDGARGNLSQCEALADKLKNEQGVNLPPIMLDPPENLPNGAFFEANATPKDTAVEDKPSQR